ncbi:hypothetical protein HNQ02_002386 [Flavobacterium sp. 7E]|nr:hypothetical protein [Flavobacterium sp. 7E]
MSSKLFYSPTNLIVVLKLMGQVQKSIITCLINLAIKFQTHVVALSISFFWRVII